MVMLQSVVAEESRLRKASLGSIEFITSLFKSEDESNQIKDAVNASLYGKDFVHAALSVDQKVFLRLLFFAGPKSSLPT